MAANSLGVLTLDLVARIGGFVDPLRRAEQESNNSFGRMRDGINKYGAAISASVLAAGAAIGAITAETVHNASEIAKLSVIAGTSTDQFQRMAAGAKAFGFEQDALADILKDSQEKLGEFTAIGGGGALDFFEQIASKVGVTAKMFEGLSGAQGLQLYVSTLEKANVSQNEMIFYMESLASESSKLLPLLKDNGAAVKLFGDAAAAAGAILDKETIKKSNELKGALYLLDLQVTGVKNNIGSNLVPTLLDLSNAFTAPTENGDKLIDWSKHFADGLRGVGAVILSLIGGLHTLGKLALVIPRSLGPAFTAQKNPLQKIGQNIKDGLKDVLDTNNDYGKRVDDLLLGNQVSADTATIGAALNQSDAEQKAQAERAAGAKMAAEKQLAYEKFVMLNASEVENVKYKYAQMRKEIAANTQFTVSEKSRATNAVNTAESNELAVLRKRLSDESKAKVEAADLARYQKEQELKSYSVMNAGELEQIKAQYDAERSEVMRKSDFTIAEKKRVIAEINKAEAVAIDDYVSREKAALSLYTSMNKTELQLIHDKYNAMRDEVKRTSSLRDEAKKQALNALNQAEQKELKDYNDAQDQKTNDLRASLDERYRIELDYQRKIKEILDSGMSDAEAAQFIDVAGVNKDKANAAYDKPLTDISNRMYGMGTDDKFSQLNAQYEQERDIILEHTEGNEIARQELLSKLQEEFHQAQMMTTLAYGSDIAGNMAEIMKATGDDQSKAYKAMFAVSKAFAIADAGVNILKGIAAASSLVFPANLAAMASVATATAGLVGNIQSIRMVGQAHDGIMSVPESGSWNLQRGERVLPQDTAQRLDNTLERINSSGQSASGINVEINNYGSSKAFEVQQIDENHVRIIARDEVARGAGRAAAADMSNPNSDMSKAMQRNLVVERRR